MSIQMLIDWNESKTLQKSKTPQKLTRMGVAASRMVCAQFEFKLNLIYSNFGGFLVVKVFEKSILKY